MHSLVLPAGPGHLKKLWNHDYKYNKYMTLSLAIPWGLLGAMGAKDNLSELLLMSNTDGNTFS